jgi:ATP-dependent Clp protease ATP-binding subunit ClpX
MKPVDIYDFLQQDVMGQDDTLKFVSVAIFKHLQGEKFGNLLFIGNSGTGKTTVMRAVERLYREHEELAEYRTVVVLNANTLSSEEGIVDSSRLFHRLEEKARAILGDEASPEEVGNYMEKATVCFDEIDKISAVVGGKPFVTGINIQQAVLTLIEGEKVLHHVTAYKDGVPTKVGVPVDTGKMLYLCGGAFESLYDQVYRRVTSPTSKVKLPTKTVYDKGSVEIREVFTLKDHFRMDDLFDYGMLPQFLSRFDNSIILDDLSSETLRRILVEPADSVLNSSRRFFKNFGIELDVTEKAQLRIADEAAKFSRIGARALKAVYGRIIKPYEFDPFSTEEVRKDGSTHRLTIDEKVIDKALAGRPVG